MYIGVVEIGWEARRGGHPQTPFVWVETNSYLLVMQFPCAKSVAMNQEYINILVLITNSTTHFHLELQNVGFSQKAPHSSIWPNLQIKHHDQLNLSVSIFDSQPLQLFINMLVHTLIKFHRILDKNDILDCFVICKKLCIFI